MECGDVAGAELFDKLEPEPQNNLCSILVLRIRDPVLFYPPDPGSGSRMLLSRIPDLTYFCIKAIKKFVNSLYTKIGRIRDPVLFYPPDPVLFYPPDPGCFYPRSRIRPIFVKRLLKKFVNSLYTKIGRIWDLVLFYPPDQGSGSGMEQCSDPDPGSGIKHPGSATLQYTAHNCL
jgi:hypothetical protein